MRDSRTAVLGSIPGDTRQAILSESDCRIESGGSDGLRSPGMLTLLFGISG